MAGPETLLCLRAAGFEPAKQVGFTEWGCAGAPRDRASVLSMTQ
jgi:hypothetical protein